MIAKTRRLINKGDLCRFFNLNRGNKLDYQKLRRKILTDEVLEELGLTPEEYTKIRSDFSFELTKKVIEYFQIEADEIDELRV